MVRVAGGIAGELELGSLEYAVAELGVRLAVVLGHSGCGAVRAAVECTLSGQPPAGEGALAAVVRAIQPNVRPVVTRSGAEDDCMAAAVAANARANTLRLTQQSSVLRRCAERGSLACLTAEYDLATGLVAFFGGSRAG